MIRDFMMGSEWLFYKIYCGEKTADKLIGSFVGPVSESLKANGVIDDWFFIRYADPNPHIRWRLHFSDTSKIGEAILAVYASLNPYVQSKQIHKVVTDSYKREIERYGVKTMELCERFFGLDSAMVSSMQALLGTFADPEQSRWLFGLAAIDTLLDCFGYSLENKHALLSRLAEGFGKEFNKGATLENQLSTKYRNNRKLIYNFLQRNDENAAPLYELLDRRAEGWKAYSTEFSELMQQQNGPVLDDLMGSMIHMCMNRTFVIQQRKHEMVEYSFLERYYRSEVAKIKYGK